MPVIIGFLVFFVTMTGIVYSLPKYKIECDSGFVTSYNINTSIDDGVIIYYEDSIIKYRKMKDTEICSFIEEK